jgi:hypothetical protein
MFHFPTTLKTKRKLHFSNNYIIVIRKPKLSKHNSSLFSRREEARWGCTLSNPPRQFPTLSSRFRRKNIHRASSSAQIQKSLVTSAPHLRLHATHQPESSSSTPPQHRHLRRLPHRARSYGNASSAPPPSMSTPGALRWPCGLPCLGGWRLSLVRALQAAAATYLGWADLFVLHFLHLDHCLKSQMHYLF